jgi:hypothetical protein
MSVFVCYLEDANFLNFKLRIGSSVSRDLLMNLSCHKIYFFSAMIITSPYWGRSWSLIHSRVIIP